MYGRSKHPPPLIPWLMQPCVRLWNYIADKACKHAQPATVEVLVKCITYINIPSIKRNHVLSTLLNIVCANCGIFLYYEVSKFCYSLYNRPPINNVYTGSKPGHQKSMTIKHNVTPKYWFYFLFLSKSNMCHFPPCINCFNKSYPQTPQMTTYVLFE